MCKRAIEEIAALKRLQAAAAHVLEEINGMTDASDQSEHGEKGFRNAVCRYEVQLIQEALWKAHGRQSRAAKLLGLSQSTLSWKIKKYKINSREFIEGE